MSGPIKQTPRFIAAQALDEVIHNGGFSGAVLDQRLSGHALSPEDKGFATELFYGSLRWKTALEESLHKACTKPNSKIHKKIFSHLLLAAYQLHHLQERIPPYAAINEAALRKKSKSPWRALPMRFYGTSRNPPICILPTMPISISSQNHILFLPPFSPPPWLAPQKANGHKPANRSTSDRASPFALKARPRTSKHGWRNFEKNKSEWRRTLGAPKPLFCTEPVTFKILPGFAEGRFWVQDAASQLCALLCSVEPGATVYDLCAAPGGKVSSSKASWVKKIASPALKFHPPRKNGCVKTLNA